MNKDRVDVLFKLADASWRSFERRSAYEWRICLALWSGLGLFSAYLLKGEAHFSHRATAIVAVILVCSGIWCLYALVWTPGLYERNQRDKAQADTFWGSVETEIGFKPREVFQPDSQWNWSHGTQIGITTLLMLLAIFAVFAT